MSRSQVAIVVGVLLVVAGCAALGASLGAAQALFRKVRASAPTRATKGQP